MKAFGIDIDEVQRTEFGMIAESLWSIYHARREPCALADDDWRFTISEHELRRALFELLEERYEYWKGTDGHP